MLERSRRRLISKGLEEKALFHLGPAERLPFADRSVDALFSSFMLDMHDAPARQTLLREAGRVLKPGSRARWVVMDAKPKSLVARLLADAYRRCYGRWNWLWMLLFNGYAPHCRPIDLAPDLEATGWRIVERRHSFVTIFPVAIFIAEPPAF